MNLGICRIKLRFPENQSLKAKRQILHSLIARMRNRFNITVAEVADQELWQVSLLGFACLSNEANHIHETLARVVNFIQGHKGDIEVVDYETEVFPV